MLVSLFILLIFSSFSHFAFACGEDLTPERITQRTLDHYDQEGASAYHERTKKADLSALYKLFMTRVEEHSQGRRILDAGCGPGRDSLFFLNQGYDVVSYDGSRSMVDFTSNLLGQSALHLRFNEISFKNEFDGIWAMSSLLHAPLEQLPSILDKHFEALKVGGVMFMSFLSDKDGNGESFSLEGPEYSRGRRWLKFSAKDLAEILGKFENIEVLSIRDPQSDALKRKAGAEGIYWTEAFVRKVDSPTKDPVVVDIQTTYRLK